MNKGDKLDRQIEHVALLATMIYAAETKISEMPPAPSYCVGKALKILEASTEELYKLETQRAGLDKIYS